MKKVVQISALLLAIAFISSCIFSTTVRRMVWYNFADINDYKIFPNRPLQAAATPFTYPKTSTTLSLNTLIPQANNDVENFCKQTNTVAFIVIKNDSICYEKYFSKYSDSSIVPSFSMAKSVTSLLIGKAIEEGLIASVQDPITKYIKGMDDEFQKVTIEHVLQMTSGIAFNESYANPTGEAGKFYYGDDLTTAVTDLQLAEKPGTKFNYVSGNTQLLGAVLQGALKGKSITAYLQEKIWTPLGMEFPATWSTDHKRADAIEKTFCCLNARARDFAKIGSMMLHQGYWNGQQIINKEWVAASTHANVTQGGVSFYKYQWWLPGTNDFMAEGILGQFVYVNPTKNLVMVRLGKNPGNTDWSQLFVDLASKL